MRYSGSFEEVFGSRPPRVLLAKPGLDGHDRAIYVLAQALRDAGMEVLYAGLFTPPEEIVEIAIAEDVDVIGLSLLNGQHMTSFPKVIKILRERGRDDIAVVGGGTIPPRDRRALEEMGITGNFGPGTPIDEIVEHIRARALEARRRKVSSI
ncbi:MAG TPA: cobalamin B12-binding domain-containing protein [Nitrososphaeria archaeon]|nr:cobalamin B12-binding domain-containing protein [Nitrososphaeria archaeon]